MFILYGGNNSNISIKSSSFDLLRIKSKIEFVKE